jgi:hypothetical protein
MQENPAQRKVFPLVLYADGIVDYLPNMGELLPD